MELGAGPLVAVWVSCRIKTNICCACADQLVVTCTLNRALTKYKLPFMHAENDHRNRITGRRPLYDVSSLYINTALPFRYSTAVAA